ncbi:MAG TPA: hypothetical protein VLV31_08235 [Candidatus Acidoferrales bacterium]|nr:hypothetical protein [Candidatus Acidoferrales bacterium]
MRSKKTFLLLLAVLLALALRVQPQPASAIGVANVVVTNVFWGGDPSAPDTAHPGDQNIQLSIILTNVGDDVARNVNATLMISTPIVYSYYVNGVQVNQTSISQFAGDIQAGQTYTLKYTLSIEPSAKEGIYQYGLELNYQSARELQQIDTTVSINVPIWRGDIHVQGVQTNPTKMYPDSKAVQVAVTIVNSGQGTAKNVQLVLNLFYPFSPSSSGSDEIFVGNLPPGQTAMANFIVDVATNATWGQYSVILARTSDNGGLIPVGQVPLYIAEKVKYDIESITPSIVHSGDSGDVISVVIRNAGTVKADSVRVELLVGNFFTGTLTDFLGDMEANETKTAFFTVDIDSSAQPGHYTIDLRFDWTQDNNALDDTYPITLTVQSPGAPVTLIAVLVIVVCGGAVFIYMRKRKAKAAARAPPSTSSGSASNQEKKP